jgi:hypothetical protein
MVRVPGAQKARVVDIGLERGEQEQAAGAASRQPGLARARAAVSSTIVASTTLASTPGA